VTNSVRRRAADAIPLALLVAGGAAWLPHAAVASDVALGRPYQWTRPPSYARCTDPGDSIQLTDGSRAGSDYIWLDRRSVGWDASVGDAIGICIDLGRPCQLDSVVVCTAVFPPAEVLLPSLFCAAGDELARLAWAGAQDARALSVPDSGRAHRVRLRVPLTGSGRYVLVAAMLHGRYYFADEIEVHGSVRPPGPETASESAAGPLGRRFGPVDLALAAAAQRRAWAMRAALPELGVPAADLAHLVVAGEESLRFMARARAWQAAGAAPLLVRRVNPWTPTTPWSDVQPAATETLELWPGAWGATALEVACAAAVPVEVPLVLAATAPGTPLGTLREVLPVEARDGRWSGDALPRAGDSLRVRPGEVRQVWIDVDASGATPGLHLLRLTVGAQRFELPVRVHLLRSEEPLPGGPALHALDWIYPEDFPLTRIAPEAAVRDNAGHGIDTWWIGSVALPWPAPSSIDAAGHLTAPLDFTACDRQLAIHRAGGDGVLGFFWNFDSHAADPSGGRFRHPYDTPAWRQAVREWLDAWLAHLSATGYDRTRILMQPFDETTSPAVARFFRILHALRPDLAFVLTITGLATPSELHALESELAVAILERSTLEARSAWSRAAALRGTQVWTYEVPRPAKAIAALAGYRWLPIEAWARGLAGCAFWAYGDAGPVSGDAWDDFDGPLPDFTVVYGLPGAPRPLHEDFVPSKRWQAFRIGRQETALFAAVAAGDAAWRDVVLRALGAQDAAREMEALRRHALEILE
jgi:hypothetical protein